jgi:hypothetical protein
MIQDPGSRSVREDGRSVLERNKNVELLFSGFFMGRDKKYHP